MIPLSLMRREGACLRCLARYVAQPTERNLAALREAWRLALVALAVWEGKR